MKKINILMLCMQATALGSLFGCSNNNVLDEWYGEYTLLSTEERCTLALNNDKTYIIKYLDNAIRALTLIIKPKEMLGLNLEYAIYQVIITQQMALDVRMALLF